MKGSREVNRKAQRVSFLLVASALGLTMTAADAAERTRAPWYGVVPPGPMTDPEVAPVADAPTDVGTAPLLFPLPQDPTGALSIDRLWSSLEKIVDFSREDRRSGAPLWGRISGTESQKKTVGWAAGRFRAGGIADVHVDTFSIDPLWFPKSWEVRVPAVAGAGAHDIVLQSAMPQLNERAASTDINAPLVYVGNAEMMSQTDVDVRGKVALVHARLDRSIYESRDGTTPAELIKRGAAAVITVADSPGNLQYFGHFFSCPTAACFIVGGEDGAFLINLLAAARAAKMTAPTIHVALQSELRSNLTAQNGYGIIPGKSDKIILISAHSDAFFLGANDNGDGLATLVGLAEFFAKKGRPNHTLLFLISAGHHGPNGPAAFVKAHPELASRLVLGINMEHLAETALDHSLMYVPMTKGFPTMVKVTVESEKVLAVSNESPFLISEMLRAPKVYGIVTQQRTVHIVAGDLSAMSGMVSFPIVHLGSAAELYHSSSDNPAMISRNGLGRAAAFMASLIERVDRANDSEFADPKAPITHTLP